MMDLLELATTFAVLCFALAMVFALLRMFWGPSAQDRVLARSYVQRIRGAVCPAESRAQVGVRRVEDGVVVDEDVRDRAGRTRRRCRLRRCRRGAQE